MSADNSQARLSPEDLFQLKWLLGGVLVLLALWTNLDLRIGSPPLTLAVGTVVVALMAFPRLVLGVPVAVFRYAFGVLLVWVLADFWFARPDFLGPLIRLILLLTLLRSIGFRTRREDLQLIVLCLFIITMAGVITQSPLFLPILFLFTPAALVLLLLVNLTERLEPTATLKKPETAAAQQWWQGVWRRFHWGELVPKVRRALDWRVLLFSGALFFAVVGVSAAIFLLMPRVRLDQNLPFLQAPGMRSLSGFSEDVRFGDVVDIILDESVALRIETPQRREVTGPLYWRMVALDDYTGTGFRQTAIVQSIALDPLSSFTPRGNRSTGLEPTPENSWIFYLEPGIARYLPHPGLFQTAQFQNRVSISYQPIPALLSLRNLTGGMFVYQLGGVVVSDRMPTAMADRPLQAGDRSPIWRALPASGVTPPPFQYPMSVRVVPDGASNRAALAQVLQELASDGTDLAAPRAFATRAVAWLGQRKSYSLQSRLPEGSAGSGPTDPLLRWLVSPEPGHCELFAGAFTLVSRAAGHPARLVSGFKGGDWNGYERYYMVRNRDAHAWVEMLQGDHWVRVDPTPGAEAENAQLAAGTELSFVDRTFGAYLDSLRVLWYRQIVNFDQDSQTELAEQVQQGAANFARDAQTFWKALGETIESWLGPPTEPRRLAGWIGAIGLVVGLVLLWRHRHDIQNWVDRQRGRTLSDAVRAEAGRWVHRFRDLGPPPPLAAQAELPSTRRLDPTEWDVTRRHLLALRFAASPEGLPPYPAIFRQAAQLRRRRQALR